MREKGRVTLLLLLLLFLGFLVLLLLLGLLLTHTGRTATSWPPPCVSAYNRLET